ncbi:hypothetical protein [Allorhodopirellula solitaria]|nr:hypothetical protein [Allorhodopirellula solitaria]
MSVNCTATQFVGALICLVGVVGLFLRISSNDGALAIAGAIVFASGVIAQAIARSK